MKRIAPDDLNDLLRTTRTVAFKFEQLDSYMTADDEPVYRAWLRGDAAADEGLEPWLELMREITGSGRAVRRVRVVSLPPTDYIRFEAAAVPASTAAGEDIRYLARDHPAVRDLPSRDFWLIDDAAVLLLNFTRDGAPLDHDLYDDPDLIAWHAGIRDLAWTHAMPYAGFAPHLT